MTGVHRRLQQRLLSGSGLLLVLVAMLLATLALDRLLAGVRIDLTERGLYTLSPEARTLFARVEPGLTLTLYYSRSQAGALPRLRDHARFVEQTLANIDAASEGRIRVEIVDPLPFSEEEDAALLAGLRPIPVSLGGDEAWLGLVGRNAAGREAVLPFLAPEREHFLEYEIARLVDELIRARTPRVALVSGLGLDGGHAAGGARSARWAVIDLLETRFELLRPDLDGEDALDDADLLLLIHPRNLTAAARFAVDRFVLGGGPALVLLDPHAELDPVVDALPFAAETLSRASPLDDLMTAWGLQLVPDRVLLDAGAALSVNAGAGRPPVRHLAMPGYGPGRYAPQDAVVAGLGQINFSTAGALQPLPDADTHFEALITSTTESALVDVRALQTLGDPSALARDFVADSDSHVVAARVRGRARSAFPDPRASGPPATGAVELIVIADSDLLADGLWVTVEKRFDQTVATPWASNGDLIVNALENLAGSPELIGLRGRSGRQRPFTRVEALRRDAQAATVTRAETLQMALAGVEQELDRLRRQATQGAPADTSRIDALAQARNERQQLRAELRAVQADLTRETEALGTRLKLLNILLVPLLVVLLGAGLAFRPRWLRSARSAIIDT